MELTFLYPWPVFAAALVAAGGCVASFAGRRPPGLLVLGAGALLLAAGRPQLGQQSGEITHALVVDVSGSMASRPEVAALAEGLEAPPGHRFVRYELSDAARLAGGPHGEGTDYRRVADIMADPAINGEVVLITDGRGPLADLYADIDPRRLVLLRAPRPGKPDATVLRLHAPAFVPAGRSLTVRAEIACDEDVGVRWRLLDGEKVLDEGTAQTAATEPFTIRRVLPPLSEGSHRLSLLLDLDGDRESRNDSAEVPVIVGGARRVVYCVPQDVPPANDALLQSLLADTSNDVHTRHNLPASAFELEGVALLVINGLTLAEAGLTREQLAPLADWVSAGGNILMAGTRAFGPGGYRGSPIEEVMPVKFRPEDAPPRKVLLLLDASDSMAEMLPGGVTRLQRLKEAATRALEELTEADFAAVAAFRESVQDEVAFLPAGDKRLIDAIAGLTARGTTHIATSLEQATSAISVETRVVMVTDGEDMEGAPAARFEGIGRALAAAKARLDVVLTQLPAQQWPGLLAEAGAEVHTWQVSETGFDDLLQTLERAMADTDRDWVLSVPLSVAGITATLPRLVRTAPRDETGCAITLEAADAGRAYPLLARRSLNGRTACLCTDTWGDATLAHFFGDATFQQAVDDTLGFLLENSGAAKLALNPLDIGAELVWLASSAPPTGDLETSAGLARMESPGRWLLEAAPAGDELQISKDGVLLQNLRLPRLVAPEYRNTGDDEAWFLQAGSGGLRVFGGLVAWQPRRFLESAEPPMDVTWAPVLVALVLLLAGYALRRK